MTLDYHTLENEKQKTIHQCFKDSFSDYIVKFEFPFSKYRYHLQRYGVDLSCSVGAFDGDKLIGFILNATGNWLGKPTVYDAGTGMLKEYRGKGHSKNMFKALVEEVLGDRFDQYLLEVIKGNDPAHQLYLKQGFTVQRELACFKQEREKLKLEDSVPSGLKVGELKSEDWDQLSGFWDFQPSWQNHNVAIDRVPSFWTLGAWQNRKLVGYLIFEPRYGDIGQLGVAKTARGKGIGSALLAKAVENCPRAKEIKALNIQSNQKETLAFFRAKGFDSYVDQYEMLLEL